MARRPSRPIKGRWWVALGVWLATALLSLLPAWQLVELKTFDWLTVLRPPGPASPVVIVGIDEPSFAELGLQWPWPRDVHARLIERLRAAGASVVAFDVVFAEPSTPAMDEALATAIRRSGHVVLAAEDARVDNVWVTQRIRVEPLPELLAAGARSGMIGIEVEEDSVVRRIPQWPRAFWRVILDTAASTAPSPPPGSLIRYVGPDHTFPYVSYYQALDPERFLPPRFFAGRIVLVGLDVKPSPEVQGRQTDTFDTPFLASTRRFMPGVELHANVIDTVMNRRAVREVPPWLAFAALVAVAVAASVLMRRWRPLGSALVGAGLIGGLAGLTAVLFEVNGVWLPSAASIVGVGLLYVGEGSLAFLRERALRRQIRKAFAHYVAPQIVNQIIDNPRRLALGGQRREITILFGDLAGFTSLTEQLGPEEVVRLLNASLTEVTKVVIANRGTVDKFMGDCIMAFWGAPLDDRDHAYHACRAAEGALTAVAGLRERLLRDGRSAIHMRIGLNSGVAIVGNMGSEALFDYTAIGDDVNLASRLEGLNKVYGTELLLGEATARLLGGRVPLRRVDRVQVKGKQQAVEVFTLLRDADVEKLNEDAIQAYRERRWDEAEALWQEVARHAPGDTIAATYVQRIAGFRDSPPPEGWDGSWVLETK